MISALPLQISLFLALPSKQTKSYLETLSWPEFERPGTEVTDAGSTKAEIVAQAEKVFEWGCTLCGRTPYGW